MEIRKESLAGEPLTFTAKSGAVSLLLNNQNSVTISPELTRRGSFSVVVSKEKTQGVGGEQYRRIPDIELVFAGDRLRIQNHSFHQKLNERVIDVSASHPMARFPLDDTVSRTQERAPVLSQILPKHAGSHFTSEN